ncbi:MAG: hypothetical protein K0S35_1777 [Geminicoccaceae bacterium]|nr:hypothetical protein [Geminicoccaceae bacterium]
MTRTDDDPDSSSLFPALTSPVRAMLSRPFNRVRQSTVRPGERGWLVRAADALLEWQQRARERRQLTQLSDHMLRDIGISRATAGGEAEKPFWRI